MKKSSDLLETTIAQCISAKTSRIPRFYRLSVEQRLAFLSQSFNLTEQEVAWIRDGNALNIEHAVNMVENAIGVFGLPLGLGVNFLVDGQDYLVPMATEEASIIAGASKAALLIRKGGGFQTDTDDATMIGQIQILRIDDFETAIRDITAHKRELIDLANTSCPRMLARGGGVFDLECRILKDENGRDEMLVVHLLFNVCDAMGANAVNSACEAAGPRIAEVTGGTVNMRIVSNYATRRLARAEFKLPVEYLTTRLMTGKEVAWRIAEAGRMAELDPYRAATHNKGIFNGVCAVAQALGQDYRAIEAGGHAYAARSGVYRGLSTFKLEGDSLTGSIELPVQAGWIGGATHSHPGVRVLRKITGVTDSRQLARLLGAVGLGQNFAACHALCTDGIQKGHMALHARNVAVSAGIPTEEISRVASEMINRGDITVTAAEEIAKSRRLTLTRVRPEKKLLVESFAPGKAVLFGEHATVYNYPGIVTAINLGLRVKIKHDAYGPRFIHPKFRQPFPIPDSDIDMQLFSRAANIALERYDLQKEPIAIEVESELVAGAGMGSSAAFAVALIKAFRRYKKLDPSTQWNNGIFDDVQRLESVFHGNPSGMDPAAILSGGVLWFRKGQPREMLPIRVPVRMEGAVCIVERGARTVDMVNMVAQRRDKTPDKINDLLTNIGSLTVDAGIALGTGDIRAVGSLMVKNHELLARLGVSTPGLDDAVEFCLTNGAMGAKLTGAGGGGAIIALIPRERRNEFIDLLTDRYELVFPFTLGLPG